MLFVTAMEKENLGNQIACLCISNILTFPAAAWRLGFKLTCIREVKGQAVNTVDPWRIQGLRALTSSAVENLHITIVSPPHTWIPKCWADRWTTQVWTVWVNWIVWVIWKKSTCKGIRTVQICVGQGPTAVLCGNFPMRMGHWWVLAHPQIVGATCNKGSSLDNHKGLRDNQELTVSWLTRYISYKRPDWEKWLFYLMHRKQHRESRRWKNRGMT